LEHDSYFFHKLPKLAQEIALRNMKSEREYSWLNNLDDVVRELAQKWRLELGDVLEGGNGSLIIDATREGKSVILKLALPGNSIYTEALVLRAANGNGYVKLYEFDFDLDALLLEKLGKPLSGALKTIDEHIVILCAALNKSWVKPELFNLPNAVHKATEMKDLIRSEWKSLDEPFSKQTLDLAMDYVEARIKTYDPENSVLAHGDAHGFNILEDANGEYKFVDPDGIIADKGFDLICIMRDWSDNLLAGDPLELLLERCKWLSELTNVNTTSIWQWGYLGRLVIGLTLLKLGKEHEGRRTLEVADKISHHRVF
jgi:streptomycin 6-kinase